MRVGIIGTGAIAREHAQAIALTDGHLVLSAAADPHPGRLQAFCREFGARSYPDAAHLLADPRIDLVTIATPPSAHEMVAVEALDRGKFVLCEKPLAHSMASAIRIAESARRHSGRFAVSHQLRYHPPFQRLLWLCANHWIGDIESAEISRHSYLPRAENGPAAWWGQWDVAGGGVLVTQVIHELDLLLLAMGRPVRVKAEADTRYTAIESEDYIDVTFGFEDGRTAHCVASVGSGSTSGSFAVRGTKGSVRIPWEFTTVDPLWRDRALRALDRALPDTRPASGSLLARAIRAARGRHGIASAAELPAHARLYLQIAQSIERGAALPIPPGDGLSSLELCMGAYESAITGNEVALPLTAASSIHDGVSKAMYDARPAVPQGRRG